MRASIERVDEPIRIQPHAEQASVLAEAYAFLERVAARKAQATTTPDEATDDEELGAAA